MNGSLLLNECVEMLLLAPPAVISANFAFYTTKNVERGFKISKPFPQMTDDRPSAIGPLSGRSIAVDFRPEGSREQNAVRTKPRPCIDSSLSFEVPTFHLWPAPATDPQNRRPMRRVQISCDRACVPRDRDRGLHF